MSNSEPKELIFAKNFIGENRYDEALQILSDFEEKEDLTLHDKISCHLLQCQLLLRQGKYEDVINLTECTYNESLGLSKSILTVDPLLLRAEALLWWGRYNKAFDIIIQAEELLNTLSQEKLRGYLQREASIAYLKGRFYCLKEKPETDRGVENLERSLELRKQIGNKLDVANSLLSLGIIIALDKLEPDRGLDLMKQALAIGKKIDNKHLIAMALRMLYIFYSYKGELDLSLMHAEKSLILFKEIDNKSRIAPLLSEIGNIYRFKSDYKRALEYMEQSLAVNEEIGENYQDPVVISNIFELHLEMGSLNIAQQYFKRLEQLNNQVKSEWVNIIYCLSKAELLKRSSRIKDLAKAEELYKEIIEKKGQLKNYTVLQYCDLLLVELEMTNDVVILDEIQLYLNELVETAERSKSFWLLAEICLVQAKISLITLELKKARRFLIQGQQIAERQGYTQLAIKFTKEYEDLKGQEHLWENFKVTTTSISERMKLAKISEPMRQMVRNRKKLTTQVTEEDFTIHKEQKICLICRGEIKGYMYSCECAVNYCENCARALTNLDNVCWACNAPMDKSKPVKPYKEEDKESIIEKSEKDQKTTKK